MPSQLFSAFLLLLIISATVQAGDVKSYGAKGDGGTDDTAAIQAAVNACGSGGTVTFSAGNYKIGRSGVRLASNCNYVGQSGATLITFPGTGRDGWYSFVGSPSNIRISGLVFRGAGISIAGPNKNSVASNIVITGNTFKDISSDHVQVSGINFSLLSQVSITSNVFSNIMDFGDANRYPYVENGGQYEGWSNGITFNWGSGVTIADNTFDYVSEGIHGLEACPGWPQAAACLQDYNLPFDNIQILRNRFTRIHRAVIELQIGTSLIPSTNVVLANNVGYNFANPFWNSFGISFASTSKNAQIINNFFDATPKTTSFYPMCLEVMGTGTLVKGNTCVGSNNPWGWGAYVSGPVNAGAAVTIGGNLAQINNNVLCGQAPTYEPPASTLGGASWSQSTITANSYPACGAVVAPPSPSGPAPTAAPTAANTAAPTAAPTAAQTASPNPKAPSGLTAQFASSTSLQLNWHDNAVGAYSFAILRKPTQGSDPFVKVGQVGAGVTTFTDTGLNAYWQYDYTVQAYSGSSLVGQSNTVTIQAGVASPTVAPTAAPTTAKPTAAPTAAPTTAKPTTAAPTTAKPTTAAPTTAVPSLSYLGCWSDSDTRDLPYVAPNDDSLTIEKCVASCGKLGYQYAGLQYSFQCFCGNCYGGSGHVKVADSQCSSACSGNSAQKCGGSYANSIYRASSSAGVSRLATDGSAAAADDGANSNDQPDGGSSLSSGAIAGIVVGVVLGLALAGVAVVIVVVMQRKGAVRDNEQTLIEDESTYRKL